MLKVLSTESTIITPEDAMSLLTHNKFEYQRPISPSHVKILSKKMVSGVYMGANVVLGTINGNTYIADGQHTLSAIAESGTSQPATIKKVQCESLMDIVMLYQQYDGGKARSIRDHARAEAGLLNLEWPAKVVSAVIGGASIIKWGLYPPRDISKDERVRLLGDFIDEGDFVYEITRPKTGKMLLRTYVVAVMMQTYKIDKTIASIFWYKVRDGLMITNTNPEYHLREFLMTTDTRGAMSNTASKKEFYVKCCKAWNAYRFKREMKVLRFNHNEKIPVLV